MDIRAIHLDAQGSSKTKTKLLLEALGAAGEVFGLKHLKYGKKKTPTGFEAHAYGVETQMIAIGMLVHALDVQGGGPQTDA